MHYAEVSERRNEMWYADAIGYTFSVVVGHVFIKPVIDNLWKCVSPTDKSAHMNPWSSGMVGCLERLVYTLSLQNGNQAFIGVWLAIKAAGKWKAWEGADKVVGEGRYIYQTFLIGNLLSILFAATGFQVSQSIAEGRILQALAIMILLCVGAVIYRVWAGRHAKQEIRQREEIKSPVEVTEHNNI